MRRNVVIGLRVVAACALAAGCTPHRTVRPSPRPRQPLAHCVTTVRTLPTDSIVWIPALRRPPEHLTLRLSRTVPGGLTSIDQGSDGRPLLLMADTTKADSLRAALAAEFLSTGQKDYADALRTASVRQVAFSYANLTDWMNYLAIRLLRVNAVPAVVGVGANIYGVHVDVDVASESDRSALEVWAESANVPCGLVMIGVSGPLSVSSGATGVGVYPTPMPRR